MLYLFAVAVATGMLYELIGGRRDARRFAAPGRLIDVGRCRLHLNQQGHGKPVVVLEAGIAGSSLGWTLVQRKVATSTCVCSYDRAGLGWSGKCVSSRTVPQMVSELRDLLRQANLAPPYILVGHSFGGLLIRAYAHFHSDEVAGMVFVDPVPLAQWAACSAQERRRLRVGIGLSRRGAMLARLGIVRAALALLTSGSKRLPKLIGRTAAGKGASTMEKLVGEVKKLPPEVWPFIRSHWSRAKCFHSMAAHLAALPESAQAALEMPISPDIPFIILSASNATPSELQERDQWVQQSTRGIHRHIDRAGHWIQLERPEEVVRAIRELIGRFG